MHRAVVLLLLALPPPIPAEESVRFRWDPPDGTLWLEHSSSTTLRKRNEEVVRRETTEATATVEIRRSASAWVVSVTPLERIYTLNGRRVDPLTLQPLWTMPYRLRLDSRGQARGAEGLERLVEEYRSLEARTGRRVDLDLHNLSEQLCGEWNSRYAKLIGERVEPDEEWEAIGRFRPKPEVVVAFLVRTRFVGYAEYRGRRLFHIETGYESLAEPGAKGEVEGGGERWIDPRTGIVYASRDERVARLPARVLSVEPATLIETREYEIQLQGDPPAGP